MSIDRVYVQRFQMIYEIWCQIDNELNSRTIYDEQKPYTKKTHEHVEKKISWNFLGECQNYEHLFGKFTSNVH
jgi:hypothetical protein